MLETLAEAGKLAADKGVTLAFETGQETADLLRLTLDELKAPNLKVNFDPANMLLYDMGDPIRAVEILGPDIRSVHVKDARRPTVPGQWGEEVPLGQGRSQHPEVRPGAQEESATRARSSIEREVGDQAGRLRDVAAGPGLSARVPGKLSDSSRSGDQTRSAREIETDDPVRSVAPDIAMVGAASPSASLGSTGSLPSSVHDRIDDLGQLASRFGQGIEIVLAGAARLDQTAMTQEGKMVADSGLALRAQIGAELGDIPLFFAQEHQHLQASRIGDLLEQFGDATDLGRRSRRRRSRGFRRSWQCRRFRRWWEASCSSSVNPVCGFGQPGVRVPTSNVGS